MSLDWMGILLALLAAVAAGIFSYRMAAARTGALLAQLRQQARQDAETQLAAHREEHAALQAAHEEELRRQSAAHREELLALQARGDERMAELQHTLFARLEEREQALALRLGQLEEQRADDFEKLSAILGRRAARAEKAGPAERPAGKDGPREEARSLADLLKQAAETPKKAAEAHRAWNKLAGGLKKVKDAFTDSIDIAPPDGKDDGQSV